MQRGEIIAIIQARMGSTRLPGKALMDIVGKPMLWHIVNRLKYCKMIEKIVVATSINKKDDVLEEFCKEYDIDFYRGSEEDVLDRYYQTAKFYRANPIIRITSDCPLVDPQIVDRLIATYLENRNRVFGACNILKLSYPKGLDAEVFSFAALEKCWKQAKENYQREHVTIYMYEHLDIFKFLGIEYDKNLSHLRWTVDEDTDLMFVRQTYKKLYQEKKIFLMEDVMRVLG